MFSYLKLENFKSFNNIEIDFRGPNKIPKHMVFIYGENGSGKSNLVYAFQFLKETITSLSNQSQLNYVLHNMEKDPDEIKNSINLNAPLIRFFRRDLEALTKDAYTINSVGDMVLIYGFNLDGVEGRYELVFDGKLKDETLYYKINKNRGTMFKITDYKKNLSSKVFHDMDYRENLEDLIEQYWGKHTFLSILYNEIKQKNYDYILKRVGSNLFDVLNFFTSFSLKCNYGNWGETGVLGTSYETLMDLEGGTLSLDKENLIKQKEELIKYFLTSIYSDIKDVYYIKNFDPDKKVIRYKLFLKKLIGGKLRDIDFSLESTGTQNLISLVLPLVECSIGNTSIIDEADAGIHDLLFNLVIEGIKDTIEGQLIMTTHNTTLLENLNNENIYFILVDINGNKKVVNVNEFDYRTQKYHNIRERYLKGMYGAIPNPGSLDFDNIKDLLDDSNNNEV